MIAQEGNIVTKEIRENCMGFGGFFQKLKAGLAKTRSVFSGIADLFRLRGKVDQNFLGELEKKLYLADVGTGATQEIVERVRQAYLDKEITDDVQGFVQAQLRELLTGPSSGSALIVAPAR